MKIVLHFFLAVLMAGFWGCPAPERSGGPDAQEPDNTFVFLGDLHFDKPDHHDMDWVAVAQPKDIVQIQDYCRVTQENTPLLFASISNVNAGRPGPVDAIIQAGDFVEGLCGAYELQKLQFEDAIAFVDQRVSPVPFLITQGNHDITGPGAAAAYNDVILPWLSRQTGQNVTSASYTVRFGESTFIFFNSYQPELDWLETELSSAAASRTFVVTHMPVVPFDARSNWHLLAGEKDKAKRDHLLSLLGKHHAIVLCGHLHKFSLLERTTPTGRFAQLAMNSVIKTPNTQPQNVLSGKENFTSDLVNLEPSFSPGTLDLRRQILEHEMPFIESFEYAEMAGFCVINGRQGKITVDLYPGTDGKVWKSYALRQ